MKVMAKIKAGFKKILPKALAKRFGMAHRKHRR
jgi:hypothetical protein